MLRYTEAEISLLAETLWPGTDRWFNSIEGDRGVAPTYFHPVPYLLVRRLARLGVDKEEVVWPRWVLGLRAGPELKAPDDVLYAILSSVTARYRYIGDRAPREHIRDPHNAVNTLFNVADRTPDGLPGYQCAQDVRQQLRRERVIPAFIEAFDECITAEDNYANRNT